MPSPVALRRIKSVVSGNHSWSGWVKPKAYLLDCRGTCASCRSLTLRFKAKYTSWIRFFEIVAIFCSSGFFRPSIPFTFEAPWNLFSSSTSSLNSGSSVLDLALPTTTCKMLCDGKQENAHDCSCAPIWFSIRATSHARVQRVTTSINLGLGLCCNIFPTLEISIVLIKDEVAQETTGRCAYRRQHLF